MHNLTVHTGKFVAALCSSDLGPMILKPVVPGSGLFLSKYSQYEGTLAVRLERRRNNDVFSGWQFETAAHLTHVYEGVTHGHSSLTQQDVWAEVNVILTFILRDKCSKKVFPFVYPNKKTRIK